ncbi:hypothetical protein ASF49_20155 [Methylobacterium sp. Leaf104]|uniref:DUF937 domain-containing protein n=1 Tax=Methylobacterium TaxID=407 RepID=UPI0006F8A12E|nr:MULTISPECIES: DUF937 domain-containing protein [Methylobacterium]KQP40690.1 hypothetical protein ASF49_20155 [Methylobacterium sp. Leaf104]MCI9881068.1 hypothetical protein [Methylobacterium goesingense]
MFNLFDILQAQAGANAQGFGRQFGLSPEQSLRAMEALMPALTMGLQRNVAHDPTGFAHLFNLVGPTAPMAPSATPQMDMLVKQLFGSPHLSQAVLQQAATVSGVAMPALKQMLPVMAGMVVAGIVHVMINQAPAPAPAPSPRAEANPFGFPPNAWSEMMEAFLKSGASAASPPPSPPQARARPTPPRLTAPSRPGADAPDKAAADAPFDVMQQMFQTGLEVQQENARAMQRLFDTFWQDPRASTEARGEAPGAKPRSGRTRTS